MSNTPINEYIDTNQLAERTSIAVSTWTKHRLRGSGPAFKKVGRRCIYDWQEVVKWLDGQTRLSTSDAP
ncbi:MAG: hypothetical protein COB49_13065 [Alphaproteobacteria bacterium]|nr:MAG: hypothetical protein COB49_13065 [Alphaproteobacteria bacterium]